MEVWLIVFAVALALVTLFFWPFQITMSLQARGAPDGQFAAAGGARFGPLTATVVIARGVPLNVGLVVFGHRLNRTSPRAQDHRPLDRAHEPEAAPPPPTTPRWVERLVSRLELSLVLDYLFSGRRWIGLDGLDVGLDYSSRNVALTGQILAALCAASALLPSKVSLRHNPSWELVDRALLSVDGRFRLRPGWFVCDTLWFLMRTFMLPKRSAARAT